MMNLFAVAENYPDLKANSNFISLQQDLNALEDDIEMARRYYNGKVKENNVLPLQRDVIELPRDPFEGLAQNNGRYHQTETCAAFRQKVRRF